MIRNLSSAMDGPESLVEADEYLQPKYKSGPSNTTVSVIEIHQNSMKQCPSASGQSGGSNECECSSPDIIVKPDTWDQDLLRYNKATACVDATELRHYYINGVCASDSSSSRYCSDPMKGRPEVCETNFDNMSKVKEAQVGNLKLNLPLDEDDYLMPSPQHTQNTSTYMDLIGETGENQEMKDLRFSNFVGGKRTCVDNPEYLMSEENALPQTLGIPTESVPMESLCMSEGSGSESMPGPSTSKYLPQRSVEEESMSDHEYYNDLQRELQPLRRNETTV